jgi:hypothetical protein
MRNGPNTGTAFGTDLQIFAVVTSLCGGVRSQTRSHYEPVAEGCRGVLFMVQQTPFFAIRVMRVMSARLRAMNERVKAVE